MSSDEAFEAMIRNAKDELKDAESGVKHKREWLRGLEDEYAQSKRRKVSEEHKDTRTLLND